MPVSSDSRPSIRHYFVDEAGDPTLFNRKKRIVVGTEGCSSYFILGLLDIADPEAVDRDLAALRARLLADQYFKKVPSMQPAARKTAGGFHAKDDVPEVRREVYTLLMQRTMRFFAVVRDKREVLAYVHQRNEQNTEYRYSPNELYDALVRRMFRDRLHKDDGYRIRFAKRGASDRTAALRSALETARQNFRRKWGIESDAPIEVIATKPTASAGLQAADYFLWALQRVYERGEDRYLEFIWPSVSLVHDVDDTRRARHGVYYTQRNPLTAASRRKKPRI